MGNLFSTGKKDTNTNQESNQSNNQTGQNQNEQTNQSGQFIIQSNDPKSTDQLSNIKPPTRNQLLLICTEYEPRS